MARRKELAFVGPANRCEWRRLPVMRVRWLEDCDTRRRQPRILEKGYRAGVKPGNAGRRFPPEPLTPDEVLRLIAVIPNGKVGVRNRALIALLWRTGLRIECEALRLLPRHVDFAAKRPQGREMLCSDERFRAFGTIHSAFVFRCRSGRQRRGMWKNTPRNCAVCGAEFLLRARETQRFCSLQCGAKGRDSSGPRRRTITPWQERFWKYLTPGHPDECWEWQGSRDQHGYGRLQRGGKNGGHIKAHRASWELHNGPIPPGKAVCHKCDNPPCCNPACLFLGSMRDNTQDMLAKGRHVAPVGASNGKTRIPDKAVVEIRESAALGVSYGSLARVYGLTEKYVGYLVRGERRAAAGGPIRG